VEAESLTIAELIKVAETYEPCTNTSEDPSPSTQTAIDPPSPDLTSHRSATSPVLRCHDHKLPQDQPTTDLIGDAKLGRSGGR
jgi:hypothetical protein